MTALTMIQQPVCFLSAVKLGQAGARLFRREEKDREEGNEGNETKRRDERRGEAESKLS